MIKEKILTIAIPTYNRIELLKKNISSILQQLNNKCKLLIIDNCSHYVVKDELYNILKQYPHVDIEIVRNNVNIGGNANIIRCFELCNTKWLYIIGDDDILLENSVNRIIKDIEENVDYYSIIYKWSPELKWSTKRPMTTYGIDSFILDIEGISQVLFISANIYNITLLKGNIHLGYQYQLSNAPHLSILLASLNESINSKVLLSDHLIVSNGYDDVPKELQWSKTILFMNIRFLLDLPINNSSKTILYNKLVETWKLRNLLNSLIIDYKQHRNYEDTIINFAKAVSYSSLYNNNLFRRLLILISRILIRFPNILIRVRHIFKNN